MLRLEASKGLLKLLLHRKVAVPITADSAFSKITSASSHWLEMRFPFGDEFYFAHFFANPELRGTIQTPRKILFECSSPYVRTPKI
jgi:hypothetical protein